MSPLSESIYAVAIIKTDHFHRCGLQPDDAGHHPGGDAYTFADLESISKNAGFARVELAQGEIGIDRLVIAYRQVPDSAALASLTNATRRLTRS